MKKKPKPGIKRQFNFRPREPRPGATVSKSDLDRSLRISNRDYFHFTLGMESLRIVRQREGSPVAKPHDVGQLVANYDETVSFFIPDYNAWSVANASPIAEYIVYTDQLEQKKRGSFLITGHATTVKVEDVALYQKPPNLLQIDFRYEENDKVVIDRIIIGEKELDCNVANTSKALTLASLCLDQMQSDKKLTFNDNLRRVFRPGHKRNLRPIMTGPRS